MAIDLLNDRFDEKFRTNDCPVRWRVHRVWFRQIAKEMRLAEKVPWPADDTSSEDFGRDEGNKTLLTGEDRRRREREQCL